jgi:hypothetical protein
MVKTQQKMLNSLWKTSAASLRKDFVQRNKMLTKNKKA